MEYRKRLFAHRNPYDILHTEEQFLQAVRENIAFHIANCSEYAEILQREAFGLQMLQSVHDLHRIPVLPTLYLKNHTLCSMDESRFIIKAASSGTSGARSLIGIDRQSFLCGLNMIYRTFSYHGLLSMLPTNYIVLGYRREKGDPTGTAQTMYGTTMLAPALRRTYALKEMDGAFQVDAEGILRALHSYQRQGFPVRFVGLPAYMYYFVCTLKENGIRFKFNKHSRVLLGGGWKRTQILKEQRQDLYNLIFETLGIPAGQCKEFFSAVEHPIAYCGCENSHFHVPIYSRVIVRDVNTLAPVPNGTAGLLSFVSPLLYSVPLVSVITDDLAILHDGEECGCGISTPYFEVLGRAGVQGIKTCAAGALEVLGGAGS